jgi:hypothetical protein
MVNLCGSPLPFVVLAVIFALSLGLALRQQLWPRQSHPSSGQGIGLLLALLVAALASFAMFIMYIVGARTGC